MGVMLTKMFGRERIYNVQCKPEAGNPHEPYAISVLKGETIVGRADCKPHPLPAILIITIINIWWKIYLWVISKIYICG